MNIYVLGFYEKQNNKVGSAVAKRLEYKYITVDRSSNVVLKKNMVVEGEFTPQSFIKLFNPVRDALVCLYDHEIVNKQDFRGFEFTTWTVIKSYLEHLVATKQLDSNKVVWVIDDDLNLNQLTGTVDKIMKSIKRSVCVVLRNKENTDLFLGVSRKDNQKDFGFPGGKCEPGETLEQSIIRETKEETGLDLTNLKPIFEDFARPNNVYWCTTFVADYSGTIYTKEKGVVKWVTKKELLKGSFGFYNRKMFDSAAL